MRRLELRLPVVCLILALFATLVGCDRTETFTFVNATELTLDMYGALDDDRDDFSLEPFQTKRIVTFERGWTGRLIARDSRTGTIVYDEMISWEQLKASREIVIR